MRVFSGVSVGNLTPRPLFYRMKRESCRGQTDVSALLCEPESLLLLCYADWMSLTCATEKYL